jgi:hypothetical protein
VYLIFKKSQHENALNFLMFIENLLDKKKPFSFYNYIRMVYSLHYRRKISEKKIQESLGIEKILTDHYLTSHKIRQKIKDYLSVLKKKQEIQEKTLFFLKHVQDENPYFVEDFIQKYDDPNFKLNQAKVDAAQSLLDFCKAFGKFGKPVLTEKVQVYNSEEREEALLFSMVWNEFISFLEAFVEEIQRLRKASKYISIPLDIYQKFLEQNRRLSSEKEELICGLMEKVLTELFEFFEGMNNILYNDYQITYTENREKKVEKFETRKVPVSNPDGERFIPYSDYYVDGYEGLTVMQILIKITSVTGTFLHTLEYPAIRNRLKHKEMLLEENKKQITQIMKLSFYMQD